MEILARQAIIDRLNNDFEDEASVIDALIDYYVNAKGNGNKLISHIIHDIWRFGEEGGLHFLFEGRLLSRSVWDLVSKSVIMLNGKTEVFMPRILALTAGARSFRELVRHHLDEAINTTPTESQSFANIVIFLKEFTNLTGFPNMVKTFMPHLDSNDSLMGKSQVALSAILTNLGISDIQFAKGIAITDILQGTVFRDVVSDRSPFKLAVSVIKALQRRYTWETERDDTINYNVFTILSKRVRQIQPRELFLINSYYGDHMQGGYPQRLMVSKQSQYEVTQDVNKLVSIEQEPYIFRGGDEWISKSMVRIVRDRINSQVDIYVDRTTHLVEVSVIVGMVLQFPQQEQTDIPGLSSETLMSEVEGNLQTAQRILQDQLLINEGWSKYATISFAVIWGLDQAENEERLRSFILQRLENLVYQYDGDEVAHQLIMNGIDRAILRKLNVRPMAYVQEALKRPLLLAQLHADMLAPHTQIPQPHINSIGEAFNTFKVLLNNQLLDNITQTEQIQLQHINYQQENELNEMQEAEDRQDYQDHLDIIREQQEGIAEMERIEQLDQPSVIQSQSDVFGQEFLNDIAWQQRLAAEDDDFESFRPPLRKIQRYYAASRPSDLLFEKIFKLEASADVNCVINTFISLIRIFPESDFIISDNFFDLHNQIYERTPVIGKTIRPRLALCEYENADMPSVLRWLLNMKKLEVIVFYRQGHVFPCIISQIVDKESSIEALTLGVKARGYESMIFTSRLQSVQRGLGTKEDGNSDIKNAYAQCHADVYFDFETTLSEDPYQPQYQGLQQAFLVSLTIDIALPLKEIATNIFGEVQEGIDDVKLFIPFELMWGLDCDVEIIERFHSIQEFIRVGCKPFNDLLELKASKYPKIPDIFNAISFNGSKFDNQFIVKGLVKIYNKSWYKQVQIVGNLNDIKVMTYKGINFIDLRLMCGASSLEQFCKDMQIDLESSKKKIDYAKMRTFQLATENREEIENYCAHDTISLRELHIKVRISLRQLLVKFVAPRTSISPEQIFNNTAKIFSGWVTISQLALKIFRNVFCDHEFRASRNHEIMSIYRDSYKGGYTQAFILGETPPDQQVFYMDFNSMYPYIMAQTPFPTDMSQSIIRDYHEERLLHTSNFDKNSLLKRHHSPLSIEFSLNIFNLNIYCQHFDVYLLKSFEFTTKCKAPTFGVTVKGRGTIYPRTFKAIGDEEIPVFGFQLQEGFNLGILTQVTFRRIVQFDAHETPALPIFKRFDTFMFEARAEFKTAKNTSMATAVKLLINSLYGKFGQRQHDVEFFASTDDIDDDDIFEGLLRDNTVDRNDIQLTPEGIANGSVKIIPLVDVNGTPLEVSRVVLSGLESLDNDNGSFVLIASIITAIGRQMITNIINTSNGNVYYSDTDSVMMDQKAFESLNSNHLFEVNDTQFGALKNEYPLGRDSNASAITQIRVLNKKIYQVKVDGTWISKFKGCTRPTSDLFESFMNEGMHSQNQIRFIKNTASISIQERQMKYRLRLSRDVVQHLGDGFRDTKPFESIEAYQAFYPSSKSYIQCIQGVWTPYNIS